MHPLIRIPCDSAKNFILITHCWHRKLNQTPQQRTKTELPTKAESRNNTKPQPKHNRKPAKKPKKKGLMAVKRWHDRKDFERLGQSDRN